MKRGPESLETRKLVVLLEKTGRKNKARVWLRVARLLKRPRRKQRGVNLYRLDKAVKEGDVVVVAGKLLGDGSLEKNVFVAAFQASASARAKLGSKLKTIHALLEENPKGSKVKIII